MQTRRSVVWGLTGTAATGFLLQACAEPRFQKATGDTPKAKVIPGHPAILDFGDGVKVPCSKEAFLTLWEGPGYWLTFGAGRSVWGVKAEGEGRVFAISCMKALLLTLAFQPDRMILTGGHGWRLKEQNVKNYVRGDIEVPGLPFYPIDDSGFDGGSASQSAGNWQASDPTHALTTRSESPPGASEMPVDTLFFKTHSFMAYMVLKKDLSLDDVKQRAALIVERPR